MFQGPFKLLPNSVSKVMLQDSVMFVNNLSEYIDDFYFDLVKGGHKSKIAWELVCQCVLRIFTDMGNARMAAGQYAQLSN